LDLRKEPRAKPMLVGEICTVSEHKIRKTQLKKIVKQMTKKGKLRTGTVNNAKPLKELINTKLNITEAPLLLHNVVDAPRGIHHLEARMYHARYVKRDESDKRDREGVGMVGAIGRKLNIFPQSIR
jgi:hypothetical protein